MNNKNTAMIITGITALFCSCCSLFACVMGIGTVAGNGEFTMGNSAQAMPPAVGYVFLCLSIIMIIIPIAVGFFMLRKKPEDATIGETLPPTS